MIKWVYARSRRSAGRLAADAGRWRDAAASYELLRQAGFSRPADGVRHAAALEAAGEGGGAAEVHADNLSRHPHIPNVYRQAALFLMRAGDAASAPSLFARARVLAGPDAVLDEDLHRHGMTIDRARTEALAAFAAAADPEPGRPSRWARLLAKRLALRARRLRARKAWERAAAVQAQVLRYIPGNAAAQIRLGHALKESGRVAAAERAYWRGVALAPRDADGYLQLGHALKLNAGREAALPAYLVAYHLAPSHPDVLRDLGDFGLPADEVERLSSALAAGDAQPFLEWAAARAAAQEGRPTRAPVSVPRQPRPVRPMPRHLEARAAALAGDLARSVGAPL